MSAGDHVAIAMTDSSQVGAARRAALVLSQAAGLDETDAGRMALVTTELATNLERHAKNGCLVLRVVTRAAATGVEVVTMDHGPGMTDVDLCMTDGFTTRRSPGTGLGAVRRAASEFDVHSVPGIGTVSVARVFAPQRPPPSARPEITWGAVCTPKPGEEVCGDAFATIRREHDVVFVVADGLGHGPLAADAANDATAILGECTNDSPARLLERAHHRLRGTRGAAVAVGAIRHDDGAVRFAGVGNIAVRIVSGTQSRSTVSLNGTAGVQMPRPREFDYALPVGAVLVAHSDGIVSRWSLSADPRLANRDPAVIATTLLRDHARGQDDATVLVGRRNA